LAKGLISRMQNMKCLKKAPGWALEYSLD
jgi:hypothetical protein